MCLTLLYNSRKSNKRLYFINFAGIPEILSWGFHFLKYLISNR